MPDLPASFTDGRVLYAASMNEVRAILATSLARKATAANQILVSTAAAGSTDNVAVKDVPLTGPGVWWWDSSGNASMQNLIAGVRSSDTALIPSGKIPVKSWAKTGGGAIPQSSLPNAASFALTSVFSESDTTFWNNTSAQRWKKVGYTFPSTPAVMYAFRLHMGDIWSLTNKTSAPTVIFRYADLPVRAQSDSQYDVDECVIFEISRIRQPPSLANSIQTFALARTSARELLIASTAGNILSPAAAETFDQVDLWSMNVVIGAAEPAPATQAEAEAGTVTDIRAWSPLRVRQAAANSAIDQTARTSAQSANTKTITNATAITSLTSQVNGKIGSGDLATYIQGYALLTDSASTIPAARFGAKSISLGKLNAQLQDMIAAGCAAGIRVHELTEKTSAPVGADEIAIADSTDGYVTKRISVTNFGTGGGGGGGEVDNEDIIPFGVFFDNILTRTWATTDSASIDGQAIISTGNSPPASPDSTHVDAMIVDWDDASATNEKGKVTVWGAGDWFRAKSGTNYIIARIHSRTDDSTNRNSSFWFDSDGASEKTLAYEQLANGSGEIRFLEGTSEAVARMRGRLPTGTHKAASQVDATQNLILADFNELPLGNLSSWIGEHATGKDTLTGYSYTTAALTGASTAGKVNLVTVSGQKRANIRPLNDTDKATLKSKLVSGKKLRYYSASNRYKELVLSGNVAEFFGLLTIDVSTETNVGTTLTNNHSVSLEIESNIVDRSEFTVVPFLSPPSKGTSYIRSINGTIAWT